MGSASTRLSSPESDLLIPLLLFPCHSLSPPFPTSSLSAHHYLLQTPSSLLFNSPHLNSPPRSSPPIFAPCLSTPLQPIPPLHPLHIGGEFLAHSLPHHLVAHPPHPSTVLCPRSQRRIHPTCHKLAYPTTPHHTQSLTQSHFVINHHAF